VLYQAYLLTPLTHRGIGFGVVESMSYSSHPVRILDMILPGLLPPLASSGFPFPEARFGISNQWWYPLGGYCILLLDEC
jgi:hypothetical protein